MATAHTVVDSSSARADRAIGAMFYGAFGGAWVGLGCYRAFGLRIPLLLMIVALTAGLLYFAYARYRLSAPRAAGVETPEKQRRDRTFHIINAGQWVVILIVGNILVNVGRSD
jgi:fumarate reductase subunit C